MGRRRARRGSGEGMSDDLVRVEPSDALRPARAAAGERLALPRLIVDAGPVAVARFLEFFAARIANRRTRAAYGRAVGQFLAWCAARGLGLTAVAPLHVAAYIRTHPLGLQRVALQVQRREPSASRYSRTAASRSRRIPSRTGL